MNAFFRWLLFDHYLISFFLCFIAISIFGISIRWGFMVVGVFVSISCIALIKDHLDDGRLQRDGIPGIAQLISTEQTPIMVGNSPVLELTFEIRRTDGSAPYILTTRRIVSLTALSIMQPGLITPVRVLPDSEKLIHFEQQFLY